jgi:hypothetical protein
MNMNILAKNALLLLLAVSTLWLAGCERNVRVASSWQENVPRSLSFSRILVVGVSPDPNVRCDFEYSMASHLRSESVTAIPSCNTMPINDPLTIESIDKAVAAEQADAVLATILVASNVGAKDGGMNETRGDAYYKATGTGYGSGYYGGYYGGFGRYGVPVTYVEFRTAAPITTVVGEVDIATRLFETSDGALIYELLVNARDLQSRQSAIAAITVPTAERLRRDGLIR